MAKKRRSTKAQKESIIQIYGGILLVISIIALMHENTYILGDLLYRSTRYVFGQLYFVVFFVLAVIGLSFIIGKEFPKIEIRKLIGTAVIVLGLLIVFAIPEDHATGKQAMDAFFGNSAEIFAGNIEAGGGAVGTVLYSFISGFVSFIGTVIVLVVLFLLGFYMLMDNEITRELFRKLGIHLKQSGEKAKKEIAERKAQKKEQKVRQKPINIEEKIVTKDPLLVDNIEDDYKEETKPEPIRPAVQPQLDLNADKTPKTHIEEKPTSSVGSSMFRDYRLPRLSLLETVSPNKGNANKNNAKIKGEQLIDILQQFDVPCTLQEIHIGPSVTQFEVKPEPGIKVSKITSLQENIKMELAVKDVRIQAPVPGKNAVGIEIPNVERSTVRMSELLRHVPEKLEDKKLLIALGKDLSGENVYGEIDRMPHMLIAGSTGSGKSVCINSIITTLLLRTTPNEVKLLLIDPKKVEFTPYQDIPNLIGPVINDATEAATALKTIVSIMDNRYNEFHNRGVRDIREYNKKAKTDSTMKPMVQIVVIVDELADLMITNGKDVEASIQRITQLARASGIHLIVATQRPSTDVITGTIKTNIPSRIAFAVSSAIDSRIILDQVGAERLLGYGDMLYIPMGESAPRRIQGVFVSDDEINRITEFVKSQGKPLYDDAFVVGEGAETQMMGMTSADPLYDDVKKFVATTGKASTSSIQRYFGFGYNRAARIIDYLEQEGAIGPANGSKPREVYITADDYK